jgi:hypothetical protein
MAAPFACSAAHAMNRAYDVSFAAKIKMPEGNPSFASGLPAGCSAVELGFFTATPSHSHNWYARQRATTQALPSRTQ